MSDFGFGRPLVRPINKITRPKRKLSPSRFGSLNFRFDFPICIEIYDHSDIYKIYFGFNRLFLIFGLVLQIIKLEIN